MDFKPGAWFVVATFLPLASFFILLLTAAVRRAARLPSGAPSPVPAYVATGAIGLAFACSLIGAVRYTSDFSHREEIEAEVRKVEGNPAVPHAEAHKQAEALEKQIDEIDERWRGEVNWASIGGGVLPALPASTLRLGFQVDALTVIMFLMVTFIATLIHIFSMGYMAEELQPLVEDHQVHGEHGHLHRRGRYGRFFLYLSLFCFSMLNLVLGDNLFQVFVSWELVGLCSYLLIGFYYERQSASNAANKAFIVNRVGDAGFILGLLILWTYVGTLNFEEIFKTIRAPLHDAHGHGMSLAAQVVRVDRLGDTKEGTEYRLSPQGSDVLLFHKAHIHGDEFKLGENLTVDTPQKPEDLEFATMPYWLLVAAGLGIFLGCMGKSAQFPLHVWLPDAMEGPTPVSALIHAATMVAAGVYLVGRTYPLFVHDSRIVIAYVGGITTILAATIAIVMTDIKKVLAYSTVSQLGYMMLALGVGGWMAGLFHLLTHAFFKALLFLGSGSVIFGCHHEQDMSRMGGLYPKMRVTALTMLMGVLAICGIPLFSGWYSKDAILAQALGFVAIHPKHLLLFLLPLVTAGLTAFYMFRMWFLTFTGPPRDEHVYEHAHESPRVMTVPLMILAFMSICVAWGWPLLDAEKSLLGQRLHHAQPPHVLADFGIVPDLENAVWGKTFLGIAGERAQAYTYHSLAEGLALLAGAMGIVFAYLLYKRRVLDPAETVEQFPAVHRFLMNKWYFDELYSATLVRPALAVATWCRSFDLRFIDGFVNNLARGGVKLSEGGGWTDRSIVDGLVNLIADVMQGIGARLRGVQTGYIRSYILFLVLAVVGLFALLSYFVSGVLAG